MSASTPFSPVWTLIVPVKQTTRAKTRLTGFSPETRRRLAVSFALDVVTAALASDPVGHVIVVTNDDSAEQFVALGVDVVPDAPDAGLNPALVFAAQHIRARTPTAAIAVVSSDLPAVRPDDFALAISAATTSTWFVADAHGTGTTMLGAGPGRGLNPRFGARSRAAHRADGVEEIVLPGLERLRRDVDTPVDLWDAMRLGLGRHTAAVLAESGIDG